MTDAAKNEQANEALAAISQIMADMDGQAAPQAEVVRGDEPAPVLDLTRRVNADGTVTDLATPGASTKAPNGEERVKSAFDALRREVADKGITAPKGVNLDVETDITPLIKSWLDEHLPVIVERVVREEVERLARRG